LGSDISPVKPAPPLSSASTPDETTERSPVGGHDVICQDTDWLGSKPKASR